MTKADYDKYDYLVGMDSENIYYMEKITGKKGGKICKLLDFTEESRDVADPWYTHNFEATFQDINKGCLAMLEQLMEEGKSKK